MTRWPSQTLCRLPIRQHLLTCANPLQSGLSQKDSWPSQFLLVIPYPQWSTGHIQARYLDLQSSIGVVENCNLSFQVELIMSEINLPKSFFIKYDNTKWNVTLEANAHTTHRCSLSLLSQIVHTHAHGQEYLLQVQSHLSASQATSLNHCKKKNIVKSANDKNLYV